MGREQGQAIQITKKINLLNLDLTPFNLCRTGSSQIPALRIKTSNKSDLSFMQRWIVEVSFKTGGT
jgi:hypothetical protein